MSSGAWVNLKKSKKPIMKTFSLRNNDIFMSFL